MEHQISRHWIAQYSKMLKSDTPFKFAYISAPWYWTEMFLYSSMASGSRYGYFLQNFTKRTIYGQKRAISWPKSRVSKNLGILFSSTFKVSLFFYNMLFELCYRHLVILSQGHAFQQNGHILEQGQKTTRPSSDSEAATMYKLTGKSSNMRTGQGFK